MDTIYRMKIGGITFIFNEYKDILIGDSFSIVLYVDTKGKVVEYYYKVKNESVINIELGLNEFSNLYVNFTDKFDFSWIIMN